MKRVLRRAVDERGAQIMYLPHLAGVDTEPFDRFAEEFPVGSIFSTYVVLPFLYVPPGEMLYAHLPFFTNIFRQADLVIGMRFHACVLAYGAGTRSLRSAAISSCAVSTLLLGEQLAWPLSFELYLPQEWITDAARRRAARIPDTVRFREKWRIALSHVRRVLRAGFQILAVVADADYGSTVGFRRGLDKLGLRYDVAIRGDLTMWTAGGRRPRTPAAIAAQLPERAWQRISWAVGTKGPLAARFAAIRVRPAKSRGERWLLWERSLAHDEREFYLLNLEATARLHELVTIVRSRWPIEQQYRELKDELGIDHFEGRSYRGWAHHTVLTAIAFTFLQLERMRSDDDALRPTLPHVRSWVRKIMAVLYVVNNRKLLNLIVSFQRNPPLRR